MTRIYTTIHIPRPVETVFNYVTTPGNWPQWHPSSLAVTGATDHSLEVGEKVTEEFLVAGRQGKPMWTVTEREFPHRWVIDGIIERSSSGGVVTYTATPSGDGTLFEREFVYSRPSLLFIILDILIIRHRVKAESTLALQQLKKALQQQTSIS